MNLFRGRRATRAGIACGAVLIAGGATAVPAVVGGGTNSKPLGKASTASNGWTVRAESAAHRKKGLKFVYVRGFKTVQPNQFFGGALTCPRRYPHPMSGFFDSGSDKLVLTSDRPEPANASPRRVRKWFLGVTNLDTQAANVQVGVTCIK